MDLDLMKFNCWNVDVFDSKQAYSIRQDAKAFHAIPRTENLHYVKKTQDRGMLIYPDRTFMLSCNID